MELARSSRCSTSRRRYLVRAPTADSRAASLLLSVASLLSCLRFRQAATRSRTIYPTWSNAGYRVAHSRSSISTCWRNKWMDQYITDNWVCDLIFMIHGPELVVTCSPFIWHEHNEPGSLPPEDAGLDLTLSLWFYNFTSTQLWVAVTLLCRGICL